MTLYYTDYKTSYILLKPCYKTRWITLSELRDFQCKWIELLRHQIQSGTLLSFWAVSTTKRTQILFKFDTKRKDTGDYTFFNNKGWAQLNDICIFKLSIISIKPFKNDINPYIISKYISVCVCCVWKNKYCCFAFCFCQDNNHRMLEKDQNGIMLQIMCAAWLYAVTKTYECVFY